MIKTLKHIEPNLRLDDNIIIVGSSGNLLKKEYGSMIDEYSTVVRFNRSPINTYEKYVGTKTTVRVVNNHVFKNNKFNDRWDNKFQPQNFVKDLRNIKVLLIAPAVHMFKDSSRHIHYSCVAYHVPLKSYNEVCRDNTASAKMVKHSVGFVFIKLCVINGIKPTVIGFGINETDKSHYWEERDTQYSHNFNKEHKTLEQWYQEGKIKLII